MGTTATKMGDSSKSRPMNRQREQQPDPKTPAGRTMRYVAELMLRKGISADDLADETGIGRATIFRWLRGEGEGPNLNQLDQVAKALGRKDCWALQPPKDFAG